MLHQKAAPGCAVKHKLEADCTLAWLLNLCRPYRDKNRDNKIAISKLELEIQEKLTLVGAPCQLSAARGTT